MTLVILAFALGIAWLQTQPALPDASALALVGAAGGIVLAASSRLRGKALWVCLGAMLLGIAWAGLLAHQRLSDGLPESSEGQDVVVTGVVSALPQRFENGWRFNFQVEQASLPMPRSISLAWYQSQQLDEDGLTIPLRPVHAGERWTLTVRLKRPHGNLNPNGFDFEAWLLEQNIRATGYVRPSRDHQRDPRRLDPFVLTPGTAIERLRESVRDRFMAVLGDAPSAGILVALAVGDQRGIGQEQWNVFSKTGLTHLFSVSGLHITMVAGLAYSLVSILWRRSSRLPLRVPAQQAAVLGGMAAALIYTLLAGFAVPAQRTLYMLSVVGIAMLARRTVSTHKVLAAALGIVLLLDPWAVLAAGFWLSFGAVSLLFYIGAGRLGPGHWLDSWGRAQWAMTAGMVPLMLALFQQFSLVSPVANGVAIPLVSFVITPLALLAAVPGLEFLLIPAAWLTDWLLVGCRWLAATPWAVWQQAAPSTWALALGLMGTGWLLAPRGFPARWVGAVLFLPLFFSPPSRPNAGEVRVVVLDVGQGLAVHVQTAHHDLVFDTGPLFSPDANSGNRIIFPYLRAAGVIRLDGLVVSHADKDHSGGAASLLQAMPVDWLLHALPAHHFILDTPVAQSPVTQLPCYDGLHWEWDGVRFSVLHPLLARHADPTRKTNDMSCVLKVESAYGSALIPSDIEAVSETELLNRHGKDQHADVLLVPHHGSRTSSTEDFIASVNARYDVFPVGYRNRFGHPKADVVARYEGGSSTLLRTDFDGAVSFDFTRAGIGVQKEREARRRYWFGQ
ncbi:MAG TPA: DNA internalization-related competence protein ComEC/Rec2 [Rhodocyclaceae bacterium]|nr:DNA internalization-related competence protein ComEC/Rec2 [Rhodocyclaceae bacterium]